MEACWAPGGRARLVGLVSRSDLNGAEVTLLEHMKNGRWATRCVASGEALSVKPANLEPSAALTDCLGDDDLGLVLSRLPLVSLAVTMIVCQDFLAAGRSLARSIEWQISHCSLMELVQAGARADAISGKIQRVLAHGGAFPEYADACMYAVQSGAPAEVVRVLLEHGNSHDEDDRNLLQQRRFECLTLVDGDGDSHDEDLRNLLHLAAAAGASSEVVGMIIEFSQLEAALCEEVEDAKKLALAEQPDVHGFYPLHHAAMGGASKEVLRMLIAETDVVDVYEQMQGGTLLHLALGGGMAMPGNQMPMQEAPLSAAQAQTATALLELMGNPAEPPDPSWDDFVPPVADPDDQWERYPLHLAAIACAPAALVAAILEAHPDAARQVDRLPKRTDLHNVGYLPAHYALGVARDGKWGHCRPCCSEVQQMLVEAYPLSEWDVIDLIRAGPAAAPFLLERTPRILEQVDQLPCGLAADEEPRSDPLLHLAVAHMAPPPVIAALLALPDKQVAQYGTGFVRLLPLHLASTAAMVEQLVEEYPAALELTTLGREPHCTPLEYAVRNSAPPDVQRALAAATAAREKDSLCLPAAHLAATGLDAFGNLKTLGSTHPKLGMVKCTAVDMRTLWKGRTERERGLQRWLGADHAHEECALALLSAVVEGRGMAALRALDAGEEVNQAARPWGCDCPEAGGCARCVGRLLPGGWTPLHEACCQGDADLVRALLEAGADVTRTTALHRRGGGTSALEVAIDQEHEECAELLRAVAAASPAAPSEPAARVPPVVASGSKNQWGQEAAAGEALYHY